jgi:hypothetical protein
MKSNDEARNPNDEGSTNASMTEWTHCAKAGTLTRASCFGFPLSFHSCFVIRISTLSTLEVYPASEESGTLSPRSSASNPRTGQKLVEGQVRGVRPVRVDWTGCPVGPLVRLDEPRVMRKSGVPRRPSITRSFSTLPFSIGAVCTRFTRLPLTRRDRGPSEVKTASAADCSSGPSNADRRSDIR